MGGGSLNGRSIPPAPAPLTARPNKPVVGRVPWREVGLDPIQAALSIDLPFDLPVLSTFFLGNACHS